MRGLAGRRCTGVGGARPCAGSRTAYCSWRWPWASQAVSLGCNAQLYRRVLAALGARIRFRLAADVALATFFVSHLTPFGSATGTGFAATAGRQVSHGGAGRARLPDRELPQAG